jgi:hypothetical protein
MRAGDLCAELGVTRQTLYCFLSSRSNSPTHETVQAQGAGRLLTEQRTNADPERLDDFLSVKLRTRRNLLPSPAQFVTNRAEFFLVPAMVLSEHSASPALRRGGVP